MPRCGRRALVRSVIDDAEVAQLGHHVLAAQALGPDLPAGAGQAQPRALVQLAALAIPDRPEGLTEPADLDARGAEQQLVAVHPQIAPPLEPAPVPPQRHLAGGSGTSGRPSPGPRQGSTVPLIRWWRGVPGGHRGALPRAKGGDRPGAMGGYLVLHLHRLDHADERPLLDGRALLDRHPQDRALKRRTSASPAVAPPPRWDLRSRLGGRRAATVPRLEPAAAPMTLTVCSLPSTSTV